VTVITAPAFSKGRRYIGFEGISRLRIGPTSAGDTVRRRTRWKDKRMNVGVKQDRGSIHIDTEECKGCGLCMEACPPRVLSLSERLNHYGYRNALYSGSGCSGCGICFFACPEPGAITVLRLAPLLQGETASGIGSKGVAA
jgi:2-oxoglutarate ferredoxin oxidoreductase subunit delta